VTGERPLDRPVAVINAGLEVFADTLAADGVPVIQLDWRPPGGDPRVAALLGVLEDDDGREAGPGAAQEP
jgi:hypothetical protein